MKTWWENLSEREQLLVGVGGSVALLFLLYLLVYTPLTNAVSHMQAQVVYRQNMLQKVQAINTEIQNMSVNSVDANFTLDDLQASLRQFNLAPVVKKILQPQNNQFSLEVADADFDTIASWLAQLSTQYDVHVVTLNLTSVASEAGLISGEILLQIHTS